MMSQEKIKMFFSLLRDVLFSLNLIIRCSNVTVIRPGEEHLVERMLVFVSYLILMLNCLRHLDC